MHDLTRAIACGDTEAFAELYAAWFDRMVRSARRCTGRDESFCLDVVQDSMMKLIKSMRVMHTERDLWRWLRTIVRRSALDRLRAESRRLQREIGSLSQTREELIRERSAELEWVQTELARLSDDEKRLLALRVQRGWSLARIGSVLGLSPGAVDGRVRRILVHLRSRAQEIEDE